jgi:hypothetical protein
MGLLDDLKKEAASLQSQEAERTQTKKANAVQVDQALRKIFQYMHDLFRQLNVVKPACERTYELLTVGKIGGLSQSDYRIEYHTSQRNNTEHYENLAITFKRNKAEQLQVKREAEQIERFRDLLWQNNMRFTSEPFRNERRVIVYEHFMINCEVICGADVVGDYDEGVIRFKLKNIEDFGPTVYTLEPLSVNDHSLEELAKLFIGKVDGDFKQFNRRPNYTPSAGGTSGSYPRPSARDVQYIADPNPPKPEDEEAERKKRGLFGLFKK